MNRFPFPAIWMFHRLAILIVSFALLGAACSRATTINTGSDSTPATTSDPTATIVFGSGSVPDTMPAEFPIPDDAVIGSTLIDRNRSLTEMIVRISGEVEALTAFYDTNLPGRGFTVDSSGEAGAGWRLEFSGATGAGTIDFTAAGRGVSQAIVTFTADS